MAQKRWEYAIYMCTNCRQHPEKIVFCTCKSCFCTSCGKAYVDDWVDKMSTQILGVSHRHLVFTIPEQVHTFGKNLGFNPHVYVLMTEGGLDEGAHWVDVSFLPYSFIKSRGLVPNL